VTRKPEAPDARQPDAAIEAALIEYHRDVLRMVTQRVGDTETAEEVLQRFYLRAVSRACDLPRRTTAAAGQAESHPPSTVIFPDGSTSISGWLYGTYPSQTFSPQQGWRGSWQLLEDASVQGWETLTAQRALEDALADNLSGQGGMHDENTIAGDLDQTSSMMSSPSTRAGERSSNNTYEATPDSLSTPF
jgi:hypothetical protein